MEFADYTIEEFIEKLASDSPTPGGGGVAGLSDALSASLLLMVIRVTKDSILDDHISKLEEMKTEALELIDEDVTAFNQVMKAFRLPKETEEEREERSQEIQSALKGASLTPLETMKLGLAVLKIAVEVAKEGNPNAITDAGVAGLTALSAVKGARYNVLINAKSIKDEEFTEEIKDEVNQILAEAEKLAEEIEAITEKEI